MEGGKGEEIKTDGGLCCIFYVHIFLSVVWGRSCSDSLRQWTETFLLYAFFQLGLHAGLA